MINSLSTAGMTCKVRSCRAHWNRARASDAMSALLLPSARRVTAEEAPGAVAAKPAPAGGAGYVCRGSQCSAPLGTLTALVAELARPAVGADGKGLYRLGGA